MTDGGPTRDDDAAWREIVQHYGDRPQVGQAEPRGEDEVEILELSTAPEEYDDPEHYQPPPAPPLPRAHGVRLLAWAGLFGVPALVLLALVSGWSVPSWVGLLMMCWFVGGFGYLVATMPKGPPDDWDDGAVV
ncbi:MAG: hypothetical protein M3Z50_01795 [Actinomycetota bacterium]|nr:hypothetical protein [Actinomycetota bacterium]